MNESNRLYLILGTIVVITLACIGSFTFLTGRAIGTPTVAPTNTPLPPPVVNIQSLRSQAKLTTVEYGTVAEVYNETPPEGMIDEFLGNKEQLLMLVYGDVQAGFDLDKLEENSIWTDGTRVRLILPAPEILNTNIDLDRTHVVYYENDLIFDDNNPNLQGEALKQAHDAIETAALSEDVLERANEFGRLHFENFLYSLGFTDVEVVVDAQIFDE
ncbi:MAG: DUF4230 domain-containing protein [Anaerolineae bacterium]|jgi:hypothetical protein|nr:DUF4230 domain-containing protein [Anaerolineae bacterium]